MATRLKILLAVFALVLIWTGCDFGDDDSQPDCAIYPAQATSPYVLPYNVGEGYFVGQTTNHGGVQKFAIDLLMPIGTEVVAIEDGAVVKIEESFVDGDHTPGHENFVFVEHGDGSVARYVHLTQNGAVVDLFDRVVQGDVIGLSGDTGNSTEPHLHFDVTLCCCVDAGEYNELPCGQTLPLSFSNTEEHSCGLELGVTYLALP